MKAKFKAAVGSLLIGGVLAGAAVMPAAASAHGETGPLCWGNQPGGTIMLSNFGSPATFTYLAYGEPFRIFHTFVWSGDGNFWSIGHSASSSQVDYLVRTNHLRCDRPPS